MDNKNAPAYPHVSYEEFGHSTGTYTPDGYGGLTKRETIAAMCLQGLLSNHLMSTGPHLATLATECADALLNHLENTSK